MTKLQAFLRHALRKKYLYQYELAHKIDSDPRVVSRIFTGDRPLSPEMAVRFEHVLGVSAEQMLAVQAEDQAEQARQKLNGQHQNTGHGFAPGLALRVKEQDLPLSILAATARR